MPSILRFGSLCFVHIPKETRSKASFETTKAVEGRILGQEDNVSGWIVRLEGSGKLVRSRDVRVATGATGPATQQAPIYRPDRSQQDEQIDLGETLQDLDDEKQEEKDRSRSAGTPFSEEHDGQSVKHQLEPLVDVPESGSNVPEIATTRTTRKKRQFWAYEPEEEELPTEPTPTSFTDEQGRRRNPPRTARNNAGKHYL